MSSTHQRLRTLGYLLDRHDQWVLPHLGLRLEDPELLLSVSESELEAFHDPETWLQLPGEPAPSLEPELSRTLRSLELRWDSHLAAYDNGSGAWLREDQVRSLGSAGLTELVERGRAWERKHLRRKQVGCLGLVLMVLWLIAGWIAGLEAWLGGMMLIAGVALAMRPRSAPEGLWDPADTELLAHALDASESGVGGAHLPARGDPRRAGRTLPAVHRTRSPHRRAAGALLPAGPERHPGLPLRHRPGDGIALRPPTNPPLEAPCAAS
ncbi:MAG: hypothetical protein VX899_11425 [Myxococcota bacterium]|nr:hypothetical protein [Myxococcota bacterium]